MRVGIIGPIWEPIPPVGYGGTELVVYNLVNGLVDRGHKVTLFGPKTSKVKGNVFPTVEKPLREMNVEWTNVAYNLYHITQGFDHGGDFDILHMHVNKSQDYLALPLAKFSKTPVVFTLHFKIATKEEKPDRYEVLIKYKNFPFTSISDSQRGKTGLKFIKTVYNSLDISLYPFVEKPQEYFVWLGKVNPLKGTKEAILAAKKAGTMLSVIGKVDYGVPEMLSYYEREIKPLIDDKQIRWVGEIAVEEKARLLGGARAFLNPILWEEPFGLVMAEAQACGTPVISFNKGAAPEVVNNGKTGFLVDTVDQMVAKMQIIDQIDRKACRKNVEEKFTIEAMTKGYEEAYKIAIANWETYLKNIPPQQSL